MGTVRHGTNFVSAAEMICWQTPGVIIKEFDASLNRLKAVLGVFYQQ